MTGRLRVAARDRAARAAHARRVRARRAATSCASSTRAASAGSTPAGRSRRSPALARARSRSADRARRADAGGGARPACARRSRRSCWIRSGSRAWATSTCAEALHRARASTRRRRRAACARARAALLAAIRAVLEGGIARRGTTLRDYVDADGRGATTRPALLVYGREGEPCRRCGAPHPPPRRRRALDVFLPGLPAPVARRLSATGRDRIWGKIPAPDAAQIACHSAVFASRARMRRPRAGAGDRFDDGVGQIRIGRRADLELSLPFSPLSGVHARLVRASDSRTRPITAGCWRISGSTNGTFLGGERLKPGVKLPVTAGRRSSSPR